MTVAIVHRPGVGYPLDSDFFSPGERYPEYVFDHVARETNPVYAMMRTLLADYGLDRERFGTPAWNPLGEFVRPGSSVFVLCNFVFNRRPQETREDFQAKCIHASTLRALIDYILLATGSEGRVCFGNSPLQSCDWEAVQAESGAARVREFYGKRGLPVESRDLRLYVVERSSMGAVKRIDRRDDDNGVVIALADDSLLAEITPTRSSSPRFRVADYDPRRTEAFHAGASHRYVVHREVLAADVVISLSKLKTHEKVGITCGLKGFVGSVGHKDCLAHHRFGSPKHGGDEYPDRLGFLETLSRLHDWTYRRDPRAPMQRSLQAVDRVLRSAARRSGAIMGGAWQGNDTAWRMTLDLARILHYADSRGELLDRPQRLHLSFIDGIVGGEGNGPLDPTPVKPGVLIFGDNVAVTDRVASRIMGFDPQKIPLIREAFRHSSRPLAEIGFTEGARCIYNGSGRLESELPLAIGRPFEPSVGWRGHLAPAP